MTTWALSVAPSDTVERLIEIIQERRFSGFPVAGADGRVVGVVTRTDVLRALAEAIGHASLGDLFKAPPAGGRESFDTLLKGEAASAVAALLSTRVERIMSRSVEHCSPETPVVEVCRTMVGRRIHRLLVLSEDGRLVGLITSTDLLRRFQTELEK